MKEKFIGIFCLLIGLLAFIDAVHRGGLSIGTYHIRPFLFPAFALGLGWLELHGRSVPLRSKFHHSHLSAVAVIVAIIVITILIVKRIIL